MKQLENDFPDDIKIKCYDDVDQIILDNSDNFQDVELLLIKGSRSIKLEKLAQSLGVKNVL
jgi:UDP-N-acetylmuramyl pentapeptide synthase